VAVDQLLGLQGGEGAGNTSSPVRGEPVEMIGGGLEGAAVDLEVREWQMVEIPLAVFDLKGPIARIRFTGDLEGTFYLDDIRLVAATPPSITAVTESYDISTPESFTVHQNYPNPFNPETTIRFDLPSTADVDLSLYNLAGQRVATLAVGLREAGSYSLRWDGRDDAGRDLASGMYFYRLTAGNQVETRKLLLLR
ncbi:MAG: T9SS type A sorting domain-containing protein, partial [Gemmatimonadetes bacterium]|nr:T9SS type A sorting domain-containing protein [Gemmatimonadota bacterium]